MVKQTEREAQEERKIKFIVGRRNENNFSEICLPCHGKRCYTI